MLARLYLMVFLIGACSSGQGQWELEVKDFNEGLKQGVTLIDVRTPQEFSGGHLENARNINWNDPRFLEHMSVVDKSGTIYVYCLSGGRSGAAAKLLRENGYTAVYEMQGGMMKWRAANLPEVKDVNTSGKGLSPAAFQKEIQDHNLVFVDVYAPWCGPCKRMKPDLEAIESARADTWHFIKLDADLNPELMKSLQVSTLPQLQIYSSGVLIWQHSGFLDKDALLKAMHEAEMESQK